MLPHLGPQLSLVPGRGVAASFRLHLASRGGASGVRARLPAFIARAYGSPPGDARQTRAWTYLARSRLFQRLYARPSFAAYIDRLLANGPVPTLAAFLLLHEATAIAPLALLWWGLYSCDVVALLPQGLLDYLADAAHPAVERFVGDRAPACDRGKLLVSGALAYGLVKLLYPVRILASLWAAPYLARGLLLPFRRLKQWWKGPSC
ncbi:AGL248Cp [Eremothecium gossypii ATCC 10895]|uniref:AGL248Cp n=1 Tax=Eremothecium gossypii (strain ATCC 10895 / CBS 109.51 / FGSC 9923 / NRRL Y-1056) TaxID=284811 RepID=Q751F4_EREGS|nr:AGL248Cp [Eremothecium gossypii ATCC 10895]AAS54243.1 AGL248Cp [Eremothecium gossypii ATCC 10895]AEY98569.1 FAGL248Cp [Eremothecium gossypii FDAG1]